MKGNYRSISNLCIKGQYINHSEDGKLGGKVKPK